MVNLVVAESTSQSQSALDNGPQDQDLDLGGHGYRTPAAMSASVTVGLALMTHCSTEKVEVRVEDSRCTGKLIGQ